MAVLTLATALTATLASTGVGTAATAPSCTTTAVKPNGDAWTCSFDDEFNGTSVDSAKWSALTTRGTGLSGPDCKVDDPDNIGEREGALHLTLRKESRPITCTNIDGSTYRTSYTAGGVTSATKFSQTYGRFETRAAFPGTTQPGVHSAVWMWPQSYRAKYGADSGEIDTAEHWTTTPNLYAPAAHFRPASNWSNAEGLTTPKWVNNACEVADPASYHTYVTEWNAKTITFLIDGHQCLKVDWQPAAPLTKPAPFDEPFFLTMNIQFDRTANPKALPATMDVDYTRVFK